jgi:hypothetical protein
MKQLLLLAALAASTACMPSTQFYGSPKTPQGPITCTAQCEAWGMELVGMVSMGENYTDGCICAVPGRAPTAIDGAGAAAGAVASAEVQRQNREAQQQQQQQHHQHFGPR